MIDFTLLDPNFSEKIKVVISKMETAGYTIQPQSGYRSLLSQAKLWRQGRSRSLIEQKIDMLRDQDCNFLADMLVEAGPQMRDIICTNTIPGESWHNWGQALDVFVNNDASGSNELYQVLADIAVDVGLTAGYYFKSLKDPGHLQLNSKEIPSLYSFKEVNDHFKDL